MKDDIIINKTETIKRCINRINEEYDSNPNNLLIYGKQDSIILNIQRLCEACIDIAFFSDKSYDEYEVFQSAQEISAILKKDIDLVQLKNSTTIFQKEIVENGQIIYEKNKIDREKFELSVIKKYFTLKEDRKEIIDNYEVEL